MVGWACKIFNLIKSDFSKRKRTKKVMRKVLYLREIFTSEKNVPTMSSSTELTTESRGRP